MTCADGRLYVLGTLGKVALVEPIRENMIVRSKFQIPMFIRSSGTTNPVVARGRLLVRDNDRILCYDVRSNPPPGARARQAARALEPPASPAPKNGAPRAAFVSTPQDVVTRMLEVAGVKFDDLLIDLGSGDGRILIAAAQDHGARALGYEIDEALVKHSRIDAEKAGLSARVRVEPRDLFTADLSKADVVALYLPEELLTRLKPQLAKLKPGARIVSHQFRIPGVPSDREVVMDSRVDGNAHSIYLWTAPLKDVGK